MFQNIENTNNKKVKLNSFKQVIEYLSNQEGRHALSINNRGIEREALRVSPEHRLARDPHPKILGSALTHSRITTDYSEALLEFITPVHQDITALLTDLTNTHAFTVKHLNGQQLWPISMPCYIQDHHQIPVAKFGTSNVGKMKTLYRTGLTHRYGAMMQVISGVHFNFSVSDELWDLLYQANPEKFAVKQDYISDAYFGLIRNYRRLMWILPYFFGASPALHSSFLQGNNAPFNFETAIDETLYLPWATSLRMSDLGYTNKEQEQLDISYSSLSEYLAGLKKAIKLPSDKFAEIGIKSDGKYKQLNNHILQIENELYAPIRPKITPNMGEKPSDALARGGVKYIEVRALDVNPFSPIGISTSQVQFLDLFLLYCLLSPAKKISEHEESEISKNLKLVIEQGRKPHLCLQQNNEEVTLSSWLQSLFSDLRSIAILLDSETSTDSYQQVLDELSLAIDDPALTLSGQVMAQLRSQSQENWAQQLCNQYQQYFIDYPLPIDTIDGFYREAKLSLHTQLDIEKADNLSFDEYLKNYFKGITV